MFLNKHDKTKSLIGLFGIEHADGWNHITEKLCKKLYAIILTLPELERNRYYVTQIKEKFGGYECHMSKRTPEMEKEIAIAKEIASRTCEVTGLKGELVELRSGWMKTLHPEFGKKAYEMYKETYYLKRDQKEYKQRVIGFLDSKIELILTNPDEYENPDQQVLRLLEIRVISNNPHKNIKVADEIYKRYNLSLDSKGLNPSYDVAAKAHDTNYNKLFKEFIRELDRDI